MNEMSLSKVFSLERSFLVLRNRIVEEAPTFGIGLAVIGGICALNFLLSRRFVFNQNGGALWPFVIVVTGILLASQAFKGMHDGKSGTDWLLLPASPLEKYLAAISGYVIVYPLAASLIGMGLSALFALIESALGHSGIHVWTPFSLAALKSWGQYAVAAVVFIAGSASFRKSAFLKTLGMMVGYALALSLVLGAGAWIVAKAHGFDNSSFSFINGNFRVNSGNLPAATQNVFLWIGRVACYVIVPVFGLVYGYFRVFEKEARDEVQ